MRFTAIDDIHEFVKAQKGWRYFKLREDYQSLSAGYRAQKLQGYQNHEHVQAYVFSRLPATYAVNYNLLGKHLGDHLIKRPIKSVLDWGCGVGAASLALADVLLNPVDFYWVETNLFALNLAQEFMKLVHGDKHKVHSELPATPVDLAIMSYSLNELGDNWQAVVNILWEKSNYLLIVEPGTHAIFHNLLRVRDFLTAQGAHILAPCYHQLSCPLSKTDDWCHFQTRLARNKELRFFKQAERGFEDEAYAYLLVGKEKAASDAHGTGRIIANPVRRGGHVAFKLCTSAGVLEQLTVSKSNHAYKKVKKLEWGDQMTDGSQKLP